MLPGVETRIHACGTIVGDEILQDVVSLCVNLWFDFDENIHQLLII